MAPDASVGADSGRSSHSSGNAYRDRPTRVIESAPPQVNVKGDPRLGSPVAKIGIVEFSDYQCSYCRDFHRRQFAQLKKEYVGTGVVQFIHKDMPLRMHAQAVPAALRARTVGAQGRFWDMHDALFDHQDRLGQKLYPELARQLKLDETKFNICLERQIPGQGIEQDVGTARRLGLTGTPSFLIGTIEGDVLTVVRQSRGAPEFAVFAQEIEKLRQSPAVAPR
ncbi:MAG TPA: thioredoxin domain-containing protein [Sulfuricaulis sp.]|nr:thioredoxin domain-containing protein [Sulfuricaulis sp.]